MLQLFQYATSGFWVFLGCLILIAAILGGIATIIARLMRVPEYPQKCPRCAYDHEKEPDEQPEYDPHALRLTFSSKLTHDDMRKVLTAMADYYEATKPRR